MFGNLYRTCKGSLKLSLPFSRMAGPRGSVQILQELSTGRQSDVGDFARWGRLGGLRTLALYGTPWFSLLALRRWEKVGPGELAQAFAAMERGQS